MRSLLILTILSFIAWIGVSAVPAMLLGPATAGLSASATTNFNTSRSNVFKAGKSNGGGSTAPRGGNR